MTSPPNPTLSQLIGIPCVPRALKDRYVRRGRKVSVITFQHEKESDVAPV